MSEFKRYRGRLDQVGIYFGKFARMFTYQSDWKVLPMAMLISVLVSLVIRRDFFITMEGTIKGSFALTCVAIWNGCFNSIQVICRERDIVKREHRSGMHISSYIFSHMIYQALLCLLQSVFTMAVLVGMKVQFPREGLITSFLVVDIGITVFLISYAADMMSLLISALSHSTTSAMTVMPFVLIFQLVFSGGMFNLPAWTNVLSNFTLSNYGLKCIAAQADYNDLPMVTAWNTLQKIRDKEVKIELSVRDALNYISDGDSDINSVFEQIDVLGTGISLRDVLNYMSSALLSDHLLNQSFSFTTSVGGIVGMIGEDRLKAFILEETANVAKNPAYENTRENILKYYGVFAVFVLAFAVLSVISLEFIDKDKR